MIFTGQCMLAYNTYRSLYTAPALTPAAKAQEVKA
jgi:hypothetical protein